MASDEDNDLMRLRELRDVLEWYQQYIADYKEHPGYPIQVRSTRGLVESSIRRIK